MKYLTVRTFTQSGDDQQDDPKEPQTVTIKSLDSGAGTFVNLQTDRWSFCTDGEIDEIADQLKQALLVKVLPQPDDE